MTRNGKTVLNDGSQNVTLDQQGLLAGLDRLPSGVQQRIRAALQTGRLERSSVLVQLNSQPSKLLSNSGNGLPFRLLGPLGQVVLSQEPTFRWRALTGAQSYTVTVTDAELNEVATSRSLRPDSTPGNGASQKPQLPTHRTGN